MKLARSGARVRRVEADRSTIEVDLLRIEVWTAILHETSPLSKKWSLRIGLIRRALNRLERAR